MTNATTTYGISSFVSLSPESAIWFDLSCGEVKVSETKKPTRQQILDEKSRQRDRELWRVKRCTA